MVATAQKSLRKGCGLLTFISLPWRSDLSQNRLTMIVSGAFDHVELCSESAFSSLHLQVARTRVGEIGQLAHGTLLFFAGIFATTRHYTHFRALDVLLMGRAFWRKTRAATR